MKKTALIALLTVIFLLLIAPLIGNSFLKNIINEKIQSVELNGLVLKKSTDESSYLHTKEHFEFVLQDRDAFERYVNASIKTRVSPFLYKAFQGATIGVDIAYSNIPFSKAMVIEVYPISISQALAKKIQRKSPTAYKDFADFLLSHGVLYHLEYNLIGNNFNGFIKDIDKNFALQNHTNLHIKLQGSRFFGSGNVVAPKKLTLHLDTLNFSMQNSRDKLLLEMYDLQNSSDFTSLVQYSNNFSLLDGKFTVTNAKGDIDIIAKNLKTTSSSSITGDKVNLHFKSFVKTILFHSQKVDFALQSLDSDIVLGNLEKQSFTSFVQSVAKSKKVNNLFLEQTIEKNLLVLLAHGIYLKVADLSLQNMTINKVGELGGMQMQSDFILKEDKNVADKLKISPVLLLPNIQINMNIKLAKALYMRMLKYRVFPPLIDSYAKVDAKSASFAIYFQNTILKINDKVVK